MEESYIVRRRARFHAMGRAVNLPRGTEATAIAGWILVDENPLCRVGSQNALDYFTWNGDGNGAERGRLVNGIISRLTKKDANHQARWDRVWESAVCAKYRRKEHEDHWLWDRSFYAAPVEDLRQIAELIGGCV